MRRISGIYSPYNTGKFCTKNTYLNMELHRTNVPCKERGDTKSKENSRAIVQKDLIAQTGIREASDIRWFKSVDFIDPQLNFPNASHSQPLPCSRAFFSIFSILYMHDVSKTPCYLCRDDQTHQTSAGGQGSQAFTWGARCSSPYASVSFSI